MDNRYYKKLNDAVINLSPTGKYIDLTLIRLAIKVYYKNRPRKTKSYKLTIKRIMDKILANV